MIVRRSFLAGGVAVFAAPAFADDKSADAFALSGAMEQGSLVIGKVGPGATVTVDDRPVRVSPSGRFAFGFGYDQTVPTTVRAIDSDGGAQMLRPVPTVRKYEIQRVTGVPQETVTPSPEEEARIAREHALVTKARKIDSGLDFFCNPFDWPAVGIISGVFGSQRFLNGVPGSAHFGVDIAGGEGARIFAPAGGTVLIADQFFLEGGYTLIDHGHGVFTGYLHQSKQLVQAGDSVARGDIIGLIGKTGRATGPHLHWAMNWFDVRLDPSRSTRTPAPPKA